MTDLEQRTKFIPATSFDIKKELKEVPIETLHETVAECFHFVANDIIKYQEGCGSSKNKIPTVSTICLEIILNMIDSHDSSSDDKNNRTLYLQNKKIVRDLVTSALNLVKNYETNNVSDKIILLGKLIQSIHDGKAQYSR